MRPGARVVPALRSQLLSASWYPMPALLLHPSKDTWRTASPRHPPRCQVRGFGGKKLLTHFLTYISQLPISFTINENPQEWPNGVPPTTRRGPSLCLFCLHPWIFFSSADPKLPKLVTPHCLLKYQRVWISSSCHGDDKGTLPMLQ